MKQNVENLPKIPNATLDWSSKQFTLSHATMHDAQFDPESGKGNLCVCIFCINEFDPGPGLKRGTNDAQHDTRFCPDPMNTPRDAQQFVAWEANE